MLNSWDTTLDTHDMHHTVPASATAQPLPSMFAAPRANGGGDSVEGSVRRNTHKNRATKQQKITSPSTPLKRKQQDLFNSTSVNVFIETAKRMILCRAKECPLGEQRFHSIFFSPCTELFV